MHAKDRHDGDNEQARLGQAPKPQHIRAPKPQRIHAPRVSRDRASQAARAHASQKPHDQAPHRPSAPHTRTGHAAANPQATASPDRSHAPAAEPGHLRAMGAPMHWRIGRRRASALAFAAFLTASSLGACSLNGDQANPSSPTSSPSLETVDPSPSTSEELEEPTQSDDPSEDPTEPSDPNAAHLCGGIVNEQFLDEKMSFTSSSDKYEYMTRPPTGSSSGLLLCRIFDKDDDSSINLIFETRLDVLEEPVNEAQANSDGSWQAMTIDGQEGNGWIDNSYLPRAVWVYPDGSSIFIQILTEDGRYVRDDAFTSLTESFISTVPHHNRTTPVTREVRN